MRRLLGVLAAVAALLLGGATPALAQEDGPLTLVHREPVTVGPYELTAAFTEWPLRHDRSLDIVFVPADGVDQVSGTLALTSPSGQVSDDPLRRHPRMREAYGLDIFAFPEQGSWTLRFDLDGPRGPAQGSMTIDVGPRPGPPIEVGWLPTLAVLAVILAFGARWWFRHRPRPPTTSRSWADTPTQ